MTEKRITVAELKEWLNGVNDDCIVRLAVIYDNCEHIQNLNDVYVWNNWLILYGKKLGDD